MFLDVLASVRARFHWACHAYCLMSNHYHLLIETRESTLAQGMRQLNGAFTQRSNRHHGRVGHVFQGRYKAILVQKESHLLELARYVVLNPVRAGMVRSAKDWPWSSYRATAAWIDVPSWLHVDWLLSAFGGKRKAATEAFGGLSARAGMRAPHGTISNARSMWGTKRWATRYWPASTTRNPLPTFQRRNIVPHRNRSTTTPRQTPTVTQPSLLPTAAEAKA